MLLGDAEAPFPRQGKAAGTVEEEQNGQRSAPAVGLNVAVPRPLAEEESPTDPVSKARPFTFIVYSVPVFERLLTAGR